MTPEQLCRNGTEDGHQMALFAWAAMERKRYPVLRWMHAIPNGGNRDARAGAKMKATGTKAGVHDIFLPVPIYWQEKARAYHGLYIEMKKPGKGRLSKEQIEFTAHLEFWHYAQVTCFSWEEARDAITSYLAHVPPMEMEQYREVFANG